MNTKTRTTVFSPQEGAVIEYHVTVVVTEPMLGFDAQLDAVIQAYSAAAEGRTVHFRRFFLSDASNQYPRLVKALEDFPGVPTSVVHQPPLDGTRIALWMYCTSPMESAGGVPSHNGYTHVWSGSMSAPGAGSYEQMSAIFRDYDAALGKHGLSVASNTVRTWIFSRDVDINYAGVVSGRRDYFDRIGLTSQTHYIASTGIEGRHPDVTRLVEMDAYSIGGLSDGQVAYLYASDHLSPTYQYGVTFERGATVTYGDRRHIFISGTASIDSAGKVLFEGDVVRQTERLLENVGALLSEAGAGFDDIAYSIVYLRDPADFHRVETVIRRVCPSLTPVFVHAPVCRPSWLVEMECMALTTEGDSAFASF